MRRREFLIRLLGAFTACSLWGNLGLNPVKSFAANFPKPAKADRCPVCGMYVHKYPKWAAGFVFKSGTKYFHCCPKCMLHNLNNVPKYQPGEIRDHLTLIWVTEYYSTQQMEAQDVLYVVGSNLVGPMGLDLIPVKGREAAENLLRDYHGELILPLDEISSDVIGRAREGKFK